MNTFLKKIGGKKFLALIIMSVIVCLKDQFGLSTEELIAYVSGNGAYFLGQGYADGQSVGATSHSE